MSVPRILLVSNGYGEMAILRSIAQAIAADDPQAQLAHMPLVGNLAADAWPQPVGPRSTMPSGGLVTYWNFGNIARDIKAGLIGLTVRQWGYLARQRGAYDAVVAMGDVYCAAVCMLFARRPTIFVATAKSEYVAPHSRLECAIARRAQLTFARDRATAAALERRGVRARYAGNAMMDEVAQPELALDVDPAAIHVAVLPGSRADAGANARAAVRRIARIAGLSARKVQAFIAVAPAADANEIAAAAAAEGISVAPTGATTGIVVRGRGEGIEVLVIRGGLGAALRAADVVLGQAGTGNEQAAGLGKPVVAAAAPGESPQSVGWYRMRQQKLLGAALIVAPADDDIFAREVLTLLSDPQRMAAMSAAGPERMGGPGAARAIAAATLAIARGEPP